MNSSPNRASKPAGTSGRKNVAVDYATARDMLPLVKSIVADIVTANRRLTELHPEIEALDRKRRGLGWAERQRRYAAHDEAERTNKAMEGAVTELDALGLTLTDANAGRVDFPTRMNSRPAAFTWQFGEDAVGFWRYAGEDLRRPIPADWQAPAPAVGRDVS